MKRIRLVRTGVLLLLLGIAAPIYANQPQDKGDKGRQQQDQNKGQQQHAQPQGQTRAPQQHAQQQAQPQGQTRAPQQRAQQRAQPQGQTRAPQQHAQQQAQPQQHAQQQPQQQANRPSQQGQRIQQSEQRGVWQQHRAQNWQSEHRNWQQRGGYNGYRIPDVRFRGYFGPGHAFRIHSYPLVIFGGYPSFQYGGFWFSMLDPWPEYWAADWYDNDDIYIDYYGDGYYLYNRRYPRDRIAVMVYLN